ncbi:hypothetical protein [Fontivita pretiosa]|uniref:hypothetical protein n=1 Tax=Fontivita pretiosa TaxID=2989684 RepID=UPI003D162439
MKQALALLAMGLFTVGVVIGCEASGRVGEDESEYRKTTIHKDSDDGSYKKTTTVRESDGDRTTRTEIRRED